MSIAFIGLGKMGLPLTHRLLDAGHDVTVHSRSPEPVLDAQAAGAQVAESAADAAAGADFVITALPTVDAVRSVFSEFATRAEQGQVFIDHSTVDPLTSIQCGQMVAAGGAQFLDAPVSGGPAGARAGSLAVMVGGDRETMHRAEPVLRAYGGRIRLCGPIGAGQKVKLVNQLLVAIHTAASAEAAALARKFEVDLTVIDELIGSSFGGSIMLARNIPRFIAEDFEGATPIQLIQKDLRLISEQGERVGSPLWLGSLVEGLYGDIAAAGDPTDDMAAIIKLWATA